MRPPLKNKPLVEAIFELRWELPERTPGVKIDPYYKILIGTLYQNVKERYPYLETLPSSNIPEEIASYLIQYRYRVSKDKWPLIQVGPGIITLNNTEGYIWGNFEEQVSFLAEKFFLTYPNVDKLTINDVLIRYIDSIDFDYQINDIFQFLREEMKIDIRLADNLFSDTGVNEKPLALDFTSSFRYDELPGIMNLRFASGKRSGKDILLWETVVQSIRDDAPKNKEDILKWLSKAHWLEDDWFFKIIEGDLLKRFE
jgi:uncharacterized protein (TIGR04255 family)